MRYSPDDPAHVGSSLGGSDDESGARRVQRVGTDPRKPEVVRTSRFNAVDAEFGQEDTEELSAVLTAYQSRGIGTRVGLKDHEHAMSAPHAAIEVPAGAGLAADNPLARYPCTNLDSWRFIASSGVKARSLRSSLALLALRRNARRCDGRSLVFALRSPGVRSNFEGSPRSCRPRSSSRPGTPPARLARSAPDLALRPDKPLEGRAGRDEQLSRRSTIRTR
jgi:hypothetical protein